MVPIVLSDDQNPKNHALSHHNIVWLFLWRQTYIKFSWDLGILCYKFLFVYLEYWQLLEEKAQFVLVPPMTHPLLPQEDPLKTQRLQLSRTALLVRVLLLPTETATPPSLVREVKPRRPKISRWKRSPKDQVCNVISSSNVINLMSVHTRGYLQFTRQFY